jgi:two-component system response regulator QseB
MSRVLIAEDADRISSFISKGLQAAGFDTVVAPSGEQALALIRASDFDLLILDIGLPGKDGYEVLEELRGSGNTIPVIVLTARDSVEDTVASFDVGADDYMSKPFSFEELLVRVKRRITQPSEKTAGESTIQIGDVGLDLISRQLRVSGEEFELTAREFKMLEMFMKNPKQVLSREQLLSRVWGLAHDPGSNVVDVYIRYLRQKVGTERIQTVRGMGYKFV